MVPFVAVPQRKCTTIESMFFFDFIHEYCLVSYVMIYKYVRKCTAFAHAMQRYEEACSEVALRRNKIEQTSVVQRYGYLSPRSTLDCRRYFEVFNSDLTRLGVPIHSTSLGTFEVKE